MDFFDRIRSGEFVDCGNCKDWLALIDRLHGEAPLTPLTGLDDCSVVSNVISRCGKIVCGEDCFHAGHCERRTRVNVPDARVRQRTEQ